RSSPADIERTDLGAVLGLHEPNGLMIGLQIGAAEAKDRLLGIAYDEEPALAALHKQATEDPPLQGIRVLKFIDVGVSETLAQDADQGRRPWVACRIEILIHARQHVLIADQPALALVLCE